jgi:hypothetical protein
MDSTEREIDFREADRRYAELKRQRDAGSISDEEFDVQLQQLIVQDDDGRLWLKIGENGEWHYLDGRVWTPGTPPGYQLPPTPPTERAPDQQSQLEQGEQVPPAQTGLPRSVATKYGEGAKRPRDMLYGTIILSVCLLVALGATLWRFVPGVSEEGEPSPEVASKSAAPGYTLFEHDSGALSVEVPFEWDEHILSDSEGEKGRAAWSSFLGEGESAGPSMTVVNNLYSWRNGTPGHQGVYMVASKALAQKYTDDELIALGPNDYSASCEKGTPKDFKRPPYSGRMLEWKNCSGASDHTAITLAAAPTGRECVVVAQIGGYFQTQADKESIRHVLDTLETDCSKIA